jgi:predicted dithiol-disulfide oxidoreductase (DUF899 family)
MHERRYPGESEAYRDARRELLAAEAELRERMERVAALRRALPPGGPVPEDYVFDEMVDGAVRRPRLSECFPRAERSLIVYSFMYGPQMARPCPACSCFLDGVNAYWPHLTQRVNLVVVARSPIERLEAWRHERGWPNLRLLSSANNDYNADYGAETPEGSQLPACNVFTKTPDGIRHFWGAELLYAPAPPGCDNRHVDLLWPIWNFFDLTPEGRGTDWRPKLAYE